ncbi:MAG: 16S rRNA (cytidine(1402)-2'-O)-methyltransferase [Bacillaceae bacterium]
MKQQKSYQGTTKGLLYLIPTPIGNLEDITYRALRLLKEVDLIAAEDTRQTKKLCTHFEIKTFVTSYHEHNKENSGKKLLAELEAGKNIALVSDAGTPCISDPGYELVQDAIKQGIHVIALPGANAALTALIASGLDPRDFRFYGFLNRSKKEKKKELEELKGRTSTLIFYESPHRLKETLHCMHDILGNRQIVLARELTKKFEEYIRGTIEEAIKWTEDEEVRGEFCVLVEGAKEEEKEENAWERWTILEHVNHYIEAGQSSKDAIKIVAKERGIQKREVYNIYHCVE